MDTSTSSGSKKRPFQDTAAAATKRRAEENDAESDGDAQGQHDDEPKYKPMLGYGEHKRAVSSVKLAPSRICKNRNGAALAASASADGSCKIWDLKEAHMGEQAADNSSNNPSSQYYKTATTKTMTMQPRSLHPLAVCVGHSRGINEVSWNPVSPILATASDDKTVRLWDAVTGDGLVELRGHENFVFSVDQSSNTVVTGSFDETVKLWDIRTGDCVSTLPAHSDPVTAVSLSRDGTTVCSASHDGLLRIWDVATGECLKTIFAAGNPPVSSVRYAPNSKYLLAGTLDSTLRLWPVSVSGTNCCAKTYRCKQFVNSKYSIVADFTHTGDIVVGSETGDVVLFDLQTKRVRQILKNHQDAVLAVSAHDTKPLIATGAMTTDRRVLFWAPDDDDENDRMQQ